MQIFLGALRVKCEASSYTHSPSSEHSGRVFDSRPRGTGLSLTAVTVLCPEVEVEQNTFILAEYWFNSGRPVPTLLNNC